MNTQSHDQAVTDIGQRRVKQIILVIALHIDSGQANIELFIAIDIAHGDCAQNGYKTCVSPRFQSNF